MSQTLTILATGAIGIVAGFAFAGIRILRLTRRLRAAQTAALRDPLTGIANRAGLAHAYAQALQAGCRLSVVVLDLDEFKSINTDHGHAGGDLLLIQVARRLSALDRPVIAVARLSGDEFAVLIDATGTEAAMLAAHQVWQAISRWPYALGARDVAISATIGLAVWRLGDHLSQGLRQADMAMLAAKQDGSDVRLADLASPQVLDRPAWRDRDNRHRR
ncbi:GGDEF domain-containing protein [Longispora sp. K20-0274]|uniref:GGDEF domain-containing protein n=1 Tax=Longispora sp. K20-0274 TaxID=3088255 RepID=UPI00399AD26D